VIWKSEPLRSACFQEASSWNLDTYVPCCRHRAPKPRRAKTLWHMRFRHLIPGAQSCPYFFFFISWNYVRHITVVPVSGIEFSQDSEPSLILNLCTCTEKASNLFLNTKSVQICSFFFFLKKRPLHHGPSFKNGIFLKILSQAFFWRVQKMHQIQIWTQNPPSGAHSILQWGF